MFGGEVPRSAPRILHIGFFATHEVLALPVSGVKPDVLEVHLVGLVH